MAEKEQQEQEPQPRVDIPDMLRQVAAGIAMNVALKMHPAMVRGMMHAVTMADSARASQQARAAHERQLRAQVGMDPN